MARISDLPASGPITGEEAVPVVQDGEARQMPLGKFTADFQTDAPTAVSVLQSSAQGGRRSIDRAALTYNNGVYWDFARGQFVRAGVNKASPNNFDELSVTRASTALALDKAGLYTTAGVNVLRVTDRGALIEGAATQLASQPVDFSNAAWVKTAAGATAVSAGAPDGTSAAYDLSETATNAAGQAFMQITTASLSAGIYTCSAHVKRGANRNAGIVLTIPGGFVEGWIVDFDAVGGPSVAPAGSGGYVALGFGLIDIGDGVYRVWVAVQTTATGTIAMRLQGFGGNTWASRTYATVSGRIFVRASFAQIEAGSVATSPILTGAGTRSADVAALELPSGNAKDRIVITYEGGNAEGLRSQLADADELNLVADFGAPWAGRYIQKIELLPAIDEALLLPTPGGSVPWYVAMDGTFALNGRVFPSETALVEQLGGSLSGPNLSVSGYVASDAVNLLAGTDFTVDQQGFTTLVDATAGTSGGYLTMAIGTNAGLPSALGRRMVVEPGKAYRFSATLRASATGGVLRAALANRSDFAAGTYLSAATAGTTDTRISVTGASGFGDAMFVGMYHLSGAPVGLVGSMRDVELVETAPGPNFPSGNCMIEVKGTTPAALPGAAQVIAQIDGGSENDRFRIEWATDGTVNLTARIGAGASGQSVTLAIGSLAANTAFHIVAGMSATVLRGAVNGAGAQTDVNLPVGAAALRFGRDSAGGSAFGGTITGRMVHAGVEALEWMRSRTRGQRSGPALVAMDGDSWSGLGTGFAPNLADQRVLLGDGISARRFEVVRYGVGGSTMADQAARIIANASLYRNAVLVWWDGSENGHTNGQYAIELGLFQDVIAAIGHSRVLWCRNGQIPVAGIAGNTATTSRVQSSLDMDNLYEAIRGIYGPTRVFDPLPILRTMVSGEPGSTARLRDESDVAFGYIPRSDFSDGAHLTIGARRAVADGLPGLPGLGDAIAALARAA